MCFFFFFMCPAPADIYTLSLHDALPIWIGHEPDSSPPAGLDWDFYLGPAPSVPLDRKSTRLNSSHTVISYAVFCLKKKSDRGRQPGRCEKWGEKVARTLRGRPGSRYHLA